MKSPILAIVAILLPLSSGAAVIAIGNGDFSSNTGTVATSWIEAEVGGANTYYNPAEVSAPDHVAYIMASGTSSAPNFQSISQNLSVLNSGLTVASFNSYTITFDAGFRSDFFTGSAAMTVSLVDLGADGVYQFSDAVLASQGFTRGVAGTGTPVLTGEVANLSFTSSSTNAIGLVFQNTTAGSTFQRTGMIDNVSVTAVPEPAVPAVALLGLGSLLLRGRRTARGPF